jgi:hypothetical protein
VIEMANDALLGQLLQQRKIEDVPRPRLDLTFDRDVELVVVPVEVRVGTLPEGRPVPLLGELRIVQAVGGVEVEASRHPAARHWGALTESLEKRLAGSRGQGDGGSGTTIAGPQGAGDRRC